MGTTNYLYDGMDVGANVIQEVDNSGNVLARYAQGSGIDAPLSEFRAGATSYYHQDGLNSVTSLSSPAGTLANTYVYDSFGKPTALTGALTNPFQYTGRQSDQETDVYYYRARYYDQSSGRFISEDPSAFGAGNNFYRYVNNSPIRYADPLGLATCTFYVSMGWLWCIPDQAGHDQVSISVASGNNADGTPCKNNPDCDQRKDQGPIPRGWWQWTNDYSGKPNGRVAGGPSF